MARRMKSVLFSRRQLMFSAAAGVLAGAGAGTAVIADSRSGVSPVPSGAVALKPSIYADAQAANRAFLASLSPERLLHNFYKAAGLPSPAPVYGGWESQSIAGHTLGHYLTACALQVAHTGDPLLRDRLTRTIAEMARIQAAHGDGYIGGTTLWGQVDAVDGKRVFEQLRRGDIRATPFSLNDGWVPIYTWHKVHAGLLDAHRLADVPGALDVALGMADYLAVILEGLDDDQVQALLVTEHGGINDAYAETFALTGDARWLHIARRLRHRAVLDPLAAGRDELAGLHANTQIPKVIGLARLFEVGGDPAEARTARFFCETVTRRHSYVIGGNSDREHFTGPDRIAAHISETTCEACNTYNMLKLMRHLYAWAPDAAVFDDYERAQLNHIMAHQRPDTGQFVYFMPLSAGARRSFSSHEDSFWCCVGSGMESHAKHADSIYWRDGASLYVNLFIPSRLTLADTGLVLDLDTAYPMDGQVRLKVIAAPRAPMEIAIRVPGWATQARLSVNGRSVDAPPAGYARLARAWRAGDEIRLDLPMSLRAEPTPDDPGLVAFLHGPLVLAADLGPADLPFDQPGPVLIADGPVEDLPRRAPGTSPAYVAETAGGGTMRLTPFFNQYDRRTAVYIPVFSSTRWSAEGAAYLAAEAARMALARRTIDTLFLGEQQPEVDHGVTGAQTEIVQINGRSGRRVREGGHIAFRLDRRPGPVTLGIVYWGREPGRFRLLQDGQSLGEFDPPRVDRDAFASVTAPLLPGAGAVTLRIEPLGGELVIYEAATLEAAADPGGVPG